MSTKYLIMLIIAGIAVAALLAGLVLAVIAAARRDAGGKRGVLICTAALLALLLPLAFYLVFDYYSAYEHAKAEERYHQGSYAIYEG